MRPMHLSSPTSPRDQKDLAKDGADRARDRYAVGAGVAILNWEDIQKTAIKSGNPIDDDVIASGLDAAARAVLSTLPAADRLLKELE